MPSDVSHLAEDLEKSQSRALQKLSITPDDPTIHNALGVIAGARGDLAKALDVFNQALALSPTYAEAHMNKGLVLELLGRTSEAFTAFTTAADLTPDFAEAEAKQRALSSQLNVATPPSRWRPSVTARLKRALGGLQRGHTDVPTADRASGKLHEVKLRRFLDRNTRDLATVLGLAHRFKNEERLVEAEHFFRYALRLDPKNETATLALALALEAFQRIPEAIALLAPFAAARPADKRLLPLLLRLKTALCDWQDYEALYAESTAIVRRAPSSIEPFAALALWDDPAIQLASAQAYIGRKTRGISPRSHNRPSRPKDRISIGYLSADFHQHAVATLAAELFELHDRSRFHISGYSLWADDGSAYRRRIAAGCDRMVSLWAVPDAAAAAQVAADDIDILIDLTGYTRNGRPEILAHRPAPVQVSYLGYTSTLGATFVDYTIADDIVTGADADPAYTEKLVRLPDAYQINDRKRPRPRAGSRREYGLPENATVFCSFSSSSKISPSLFTLWIKIIREVPDSVLWLRSWAPEVAQNLRAAWAKEGLGQDRLIFADNTDYEGHLARYGAADLALDTFAHGGHTTASDALWMGCPLISCAGKTFSARVGASLLNAVGLPELVTASPDEYAACAVTLAKTPGALKSLRGRLEGLRDHCALFDSPRKARQLEWAYRQMWDIYCKGEAPRPFAVPREVV